MKEFLYQNQFDIAKKAFDTKKKELCDLVGVTHLYRHSDYLSPPSRYHWFSLSFSISFPHYNSSKLMVSCQIYGERCTLKVFIH